MQLQKAASGLLGWFQLKVGGRNPTAFGDTIVPFVDVADNYGLAGELDVETVAIATGAATSANGTITVPAAKYYRVRSVAMQFVPNSADVLIGADLSVRVLTPAGSSLPCVIASVRLPIPTTAAATLNTHFWGEYLDRPLILAPGWGLLFNVNLEKAASVNVAANAFLLRERWDG